jgi:hypothetical protein
MNTAAWKRPLVSFIRTVLVPRFASCFVLKIDSDALDLLRSALQVCCKDDVAQLAVIDHPHRQKEYQRSPVGPLDRTYGIGTDYRTQQL